eukprot:5536491-Prymnesium_polylepis.1
MLLDAVRDRIKDNDAARSLKAAVHAVGATIEMDKGGAPHPQKNERAHPRKPPTLAPLPPE